MSAAPYRRRFRGSDPRRNAVGWGVVVAVHVLIGWALVSGTTRKSVDIVNKPMQAAVIQEVIIPPPPPPPPPRIEPPKPAPPPKPEPPKAEPKPSALEKPDIALKEEAKKPEPKKEPPKEEPKKEPPKPEKEPPKPEPKKPEPKKEPPLDDFAKLAEARLRQQSPNAPAQTPSTGGAPGGPSEQARATYIDQIRAKVRGNIVVPPGVQGNPEAVFIVDQLPDGTVINVRLVQSSGNPALDAALERAIRRSSPLPLPEDKRLFERTLTLKLRPLAQ